jgi:hypothetical protein
MTNAIPTWSAYFLHPLLFNPISLLLHPIHHRSIMKSSTVLALSAAIIPASAGVHKMKLNKISLDEQLKSYTMHDMTKMLANKYHKLSPVDRHMKEMFSPQGGHTVPVNNYMNAQCRLSCCLLCHSLTATRLFRDFYWHAATGFQSHHGHGKLQSVDSIVGMLVDRLLSAQQI